MLGFLLIAYLIGSLPVAYLFGRWFGKKDVRCVGSRNAGATNVAVNIGWLPGTLTLFGDMAKGYIAAIVGAISPSPVMPFLTPAFAIAGHNWPVWLRFQGGGGLATFVGGCLAVSNWWTALMGLGLWGASYLLIRDHDRSAVLACLLMPFVAFLTDMPWQTITFMASSSFMILLRRLQSIRDKVRNLV